MKIALLILALALPSAASGMLFKWTDSAGVAHYTNKEYEIPTRYRDKARLLYPELADTPAPQQNQPPQQATNPDNQTPTLRISPEGQVRRQRPDTISEQPRQEVRPGSGRRGRGAVSTPPEE